MVPSVAKFILDHDENQPPLRRSILLPAFEDDFRLQLMVTERLWGSPRPSTIYRLSNFHVANIRSSIPVCRLYYSLGGFNGLHLLCRLALWAILGGVHLHDSVVRGSDEPLNSASPPS